MIKKYTSLKYTFIAIALTASFTSCKEDDEPTTEEPTYTVPATYEFTRDGESSVSYGGQTDRLNQLAEIKTKMQTADAGGQVSAQDLLDMFANTNDDGNGNFSFSASKQLKNKTFELDTTYFIDLLTACAAASDSGFVGVLAADGKAGLITRASNSKTILVDENGYEFTQVLEKGLMGATFLFQIFNSYLSDEKTGDGVDNTIIADGKNHTALEHGADEAFGYFGAPVDFKSNYSGTGSPKFWAKYSGEMDGILGTNDILMTAFKKFRMAIVCKDNGEKNAQRDVLHEELEKLVAAVAIHYVNESLADTDDGDRLHHLSEVYAFVRALKYNPVAKKNISVSEVENLLNNELGTNLWNTTTTGLNNIKTFLSDRYGYGSVVNSL